MSALGIGIAATVRDGGWKSEAMVARYTEHLQVKQGASAIPAAKQARLWSSPTRFAPTPSRCFNPSMPQMINPIHTIECLVDDYGWDTVMNELM